MLDEKLNQYLRETIPPDEDWIEQLEKYAKENDVPIMDPVGMQFLQQLIRIHKPMRILEIGTAIGYSALRMLEANPTASITSIERDKVRYDYAVNVIEVQNKSSQIKIIHGDALEVVDDVGEKDSFDLLFIDAAKGQYQRFFELYSPFIRKGGLIISDNVLFKGYVANPTDKQPRLSKIANKIKAYNQWLIEKEEFQTSIVPVGDGVAITIKN